MSAHLTVYEMAIAAEQAIRMREASHARCLAHADAAPAVRVDALLHRLGTALRPVRGSMLGIGRWTGSGAGASSGKQAAGSPAVRRQTEVGSWRRGNAAPYQV